MHWTLDMNAGAIYIQLRDGEPVDQEEIGSAAVIVDLGADGEIIGLEVLGITGRAEAAALALDLSRPLSGLERQLILAAIEVAPSNRAEPVAGGDSDTFANVEFQLTA